MKTKKIIADTMPLALKKVRQELGENAIIVNTRAIKTGGVLGLFKKQKYEVTAYSMDIGNAKEEQSFSVEQPKSMTEKRHPEMKKFDNHRVEIENNITSYNQNPQKRYQYFSQSHIVEEKSESALNESSEVESAPSIETSVPNKLKENNEPLLDEIKQMRKLMMNFMMNNQDSKSVPSGLVKWVNLLKAQGVQEEVIEFIVGTLFKKFEAISTISDDEIKQEIIGIIQEIFQKRLPETNAVRESTRIINVVGPTGVGKTTSIAKLATEQILKQKRRVAMITTDVYRIGAVEQLKTYAGILNVPIEVVRSAEELEKALDTLKNFDLIYMDTTGRNYKEVKFLDSVNEFLKQPIESDSYLALSLTTKYEDMKILLNRFLGSPIKKLILTKFDETSSYGSILNIAFEFPYQIAYITNGQSVPEDITTIDPAILTSYLLGDVN
ncbi:flagellar biosynthesis protein FlhF [Pseudoneobacillus sp. C159]